MAHELAHAKAPSLPETERETFADDFAAELLVPYESAECLYRVLKDYSDKAIIVNKIKQKAHEHLISPVTIYRQISKYAEINGLSGFDIDIDIYGAARNLTKDHRSFSKRFFEFVPPPANVFIRECEESFEIPFFHALRSCIVEKDKSAGFVQRIMNIPMLDAKELFKALTSEVKKPVDAS